MIKLKSQKVELLAPAGNFEKLEIAIHYGADAVYIGAKGISLRNLGQNFSFNEIREAVDFAHKHHVRVYVACNIFARDVQFPEISEFLIHMGEIRPDALIISDPGILMEAKERVPQLPIHLSTQANTCNTKTVLFWESLGVNRVNLARELTLTQIKAISNTVHAETEVFVHGAMCIAYSGRCLLSSFLTKRHSNLGECSQPCRWKYGLVEELRPGQWMPFQEDDQGAYILNSKDLCMIQHIPELIQTGVTSLKIEGRMKTLGYLGTTVKVYREAIDAYYNAPDTFNLRPDWVDSLCDISNRGYCTGFFLDDPDAQTPNYISSTSQFYKPFIGKVVSADQDKYVQVAVRYKVKKGEWVQVLRQQGPPVINQIEDIRDQHGHSIDIAQPNTLAFLRFQHEFSSNDLIHKACAV
ncbi:MAG: U32 family peptidase [Desulfobacterales bacterium]|nr:U32 family peptidase [Desulfobacterales bacterium]